jgi:hypothetical protein
VSYVAGWVGTLAVLVVLYRQFEGTASSLSLWALCGALLVWWFIGRWAWRPGRRLGVAGARARVLGWCVRGLLISAAAAWYGLIGIDRERLDPALAGVGVGLIGAYLLQRFGRRPAGEAARGSPVRGWRLVGMVACGVLAVACGLVARYLGYGLAVAVYWVPVEVVGAVRGWWATRWLWMPTAALVYTLWALVAGSVLGVWQTHIIRRHRVIEGHSQSWGSGSGMSSVGGWGLGYGSSLGSGSFHTTTHTTSHENYVDTDLTPPPLRTGLAALVQYRTVVGGWSSSHTSSYGSGHSSMWTGYAEGVWRVRLVQFPPAYLPRWLDRGVRYLQAHTDGRREVASAGETLSAAPEVADPPADGDDTGGAAPGDGSPGGNAS